MALWNGLGQAATLAQLAGVDAGGLISMIIHTVQTVQQNKKECQNLAHDVTMISGLVQMLQQLQMMRVRVFREQLEGLEDTLRQVYILVKSCQQSNIMYRFFMAGNQAQKIRDARDRISSYLQLYPMISHLHLIYFLSGLHSLQPQALEQMLESSASHANPDSRSGVNSEITICATGREAHREFTLSTLVATAQHFPRESITQGGGHSQVCMTVQKIVIKISMQCDRCRNRAMELVAKVDGVLSLMITGDGRDTMFVIGKGVDVICLIVRLRRRKVGLVQILQAEVNGNVAQAVVVNTNEARPADQTANRQRHGPSGGFRAIFTKFTWPRARRRPPPSALHGEHTSNPASRVSGGPRSHLFSAPSTSTAVDTASPPARLLPLNQARTRPLASPRQERDLSEAANPLLPPMRVAPARRTFNMSRVRVRVRQAAARPEQRAQGNVPSSNAGATCYELAAGESGCVLEDYVGMFDGPMPPAVIASLAGALFHADDEGSTTTI